jgi:trans-2,3-dihydro-3-hydroxyanthranilic acid synthase
MTIPAITPYPLPTELPPGRAGWRLDPGRAALLIHDMQRYFVDVFPAGEPVTGLRRNITALRDAADAAGVPVLYTAQPGSMSPAERGLLADFWGAGMAADPEHRAIVAELAPRPGETVLTKWRYSAFARTGLDPQLRRLRRDQLVVCGIYAHVGVLMTACDAFTRDIQPFLVADAVADFSAAEHQLALDYAAGRCARTLLTATAVAELST